MWFGIETGLLTLCAIPQALRDISLPRNPPPPLSSVLFAQYDYPRYLVGFIPLLELSSSLFTHRISFAGSVHLRHSFSGISIHPTIGFNFKPITRIRNDTLPTFTAMQTFGRYSNRHNSNIKRAARLSFSAFYNRIALCEDDH